MEIKKVSIAEKLSLFNDYWNQRIVRESNGQHVKLVKAHGEFEWNKHEDEDEMFLVVNGEFDKELRNQTISVKTGEFIIIPRNIEHKPIVKNEAHLILFEPANTVNTGDNKPSRLSYIKNMCYIF